MKEYVHQLNSKFSSIKFTYEIENNGQLPFLDTLVIRNKDRLEFDIYRKETNINRFITSDSNHCIQHKLAAFNFLIHRLVKFPLTKHRFDKELKLIENIAKYNGFSPKIVHDILRKQKNKVNFAKSTTLSNEPKLNKQKYVKIPFHPTATKGLNKILSKVDLKIAFTSNNTIKINLGNPKDKINTLDKSGIYEINCLDCEKKYIGQTRRSIITRFKEHVAHAKFLRPEKSKVAQHIYDSGHRINKEGLKLIKAVTSNRELNSYESLFIHQKGNCLLNSDKGPVPRSALFELLKPQSKLNGKPSSINRAA